MIESAEPKSCVKVVICICTFKRPTALKRLLLSLERLVFKKNKVPDIKILVIDNEPNQKTLEFCDFFRKRSRWKIHYEKEESPGISYARNRALQAKTQDIDYLVFIDDDEEASPEWLDELLYIQKTYQADIVTGPVVCKFEKPASELVEKGGFIQYPRYKTGTLRSEASTNNVLMLGSILKEEDLKFDTKLALTGGEDTRFFKRLKKEGKRIVWANDAIVFDWVPPERANLTWICRRFFRSGTNRGMERREEMLFLNASLINGFLGTIYICAGFCFIALSCFKGWYYLMKGIRDICWGSGLFFAMLGSRLNDYRN